MLCFRVMVRLSVSHLSLFINRERTKALYNVISAFVQHHQLHVTWMTVTLERTLMTEFSVQTSSAPDLLVQAASCGITLCLFLLQLSPAAAVTVTTQIQRQGGAGCGRRRLEVQQSGNGKVSTVVWMSNICGRRQRRRRCRQCNEMVFR